MPDELALQPIPPAAVVAILAIIAESAETAGSAFRAFLDGLVPAMTYRHGVRRLEMMLRWTQAEAMDRLSENSAGVPILRNSTAARARRSDANPLCALSGRLRSSRNLPMFEELINHVATRSPTLLDEASWAVCPHIQRWAGPVLKECRRCPALERDPEVGLGKRLCRINAEKAAIAVLNVANRWWAPTGQTSKRKGSTGQNSKRKAKA
jgi:hypothetical protein